LLTFSVLTVRAERPVFLKNAGNVKHDHLGRSHHSEIDACPGWSQTIQTAPRLRLAFCHRHRRKKLGHDLVTI